MRQPLFRVFVILVWTISVYSLVVAQINPRPEPGGTSGRGNHVIRGKIFLPSGQFPEQRIRVVLELVSGGIYGETFSDSVGTFEFRSLPNSTYRIVLPSDGHSYDTTAENLEVSGTVSRTYAVQLYLRAKERRENNTKDKLISAAEFQQDVPKAAKKSYEQGLKKAKEGKADEAFAQFQEAVKLFPDYVLALNKLGEGQMVRQEIPAAEATFRHALEISPKYPLTHVNLGLLLVQVKRYGEAIEALEAANRIDESFPIAHLNLGVAWLEKTPAEASNLDRAEREFNKALVLGGSPLAGVHKYLFNIHIRRHDYPKAAAELEAYLKDAPNASDAAQIQEMLVRVKKAAQTSPKP